MISPRDFLAVSKYLAARGTEAEWRTAVSRAYFAVFHVARNLMEDLGFVVPRADPAPGYLWKRLSNAGDAQVQQAGARLNGLRGDRNQADYDLPRTFHMGTIRALIQRAEQAIQILEAAAHEPTRSQIRDAMKLYEQQINEVTWRP
jgi:uncharacterized protein (UPF0332 family)